MAMDIPRRISADSFSYRGVAVTIRVERAHGHVFGHADLLAEGGEFMGRVSLGSARSSADVRHRLRCLAKAKIDLAAVMREAMNECAKHRLPGNPPARPRDQRTEST